MEEKEIKDTKEEPKEEPKEKPKESKKSAWSIFSHPVVNAVSLIVGLLGLFFAFYLYQAAKVYPELVFYTHPIKGTILQAGQTSDIKAFYKDKEINSDVTVAQVAIWNNGTASIKPPQILKPIVIYTDNNIPILEAQLKKTTREVTKLQLVQDELQNGKLKLNWQILEQNDGGVIQIIYAGNTETKINIDGAVEGQKEIVKSIDTRKIKTPDQQYAENSSKDSSALLEILLSISASIILGILIVVMFHRLDKQKASKTEKVIVYSVRTFLTLFVLFLIVLILYRLFNPSLIKPPFEL